MSAQRSRKNPSGRSPADGDRLTSGDGATRSGSGKKPGARSGASPTSRSDRRPGTGRRPADPPRSAALAVLRAVTSRDAYANLLLPQLITQRGLAGRDAALATELCYGTLRARGTYDAILQICSDRDLSRLDPDVLDVLRLGAHQLLGTRIQPHAAVATSVNLVKEVAGQRPAGFVNAVLRRVASRDLAAWIEIAAPSRDDDLVGHLAVRHSHPRWIVEAVAAALGEAAPAMPETEELLAADNQRPVVHLCAVPGLASQGDLVNVGCGAARWSPFGGYLRDGAPASLAVVADGHAGVQDEASQLATAALAAVKLTGADGRWLDVCAGPGGKARLLAGLAAGAGARLLAAEIRAHRARLVSAAVRTSGSARVVVADGTRPAWRPAAADRVLLDVPCSGLGALRRRPEARWRRNPEDVTALGELQRGLLRAALDAARPGGVVAYVTCSPLLAETTEVLADVLGARRDVRVLDAPAALPDIPGLAHRTDKRYAQFWPHRHGTDAIFLALLRREAN